MHITADPELTAVIRPQKISSKTPSFSIRISPVWVQGDVTTTGGNAVYCWMGKEWIGNECVTKRPNDPQADDRALAPSGLLKTPVGVYLMALFFTAVCLFAIGSLMYVLFFKFTPEMRSRLSVTPALASLGIADLNLVLTVVACWLLVAMRRIGVGLLLASTVLVAGLCMLSWPALIHLYLRHPSGALLHPLLMGGGNLLVHIAATVYAFRLNSKGLLR